ncbi:MAG: hypothetical protein EXR72_00285 [Myxococcales bacterium]|nr:hypothetical protein [Myxococcales bacterium]
MKYPIFGESTRAILLLGVAWALGCGETPPATPDLSSDDAAPQDLAATAPDRPDLAQAEVDGIFDPDLALPACKDTPAECGLPGACQSCVLSSVGHRCVSKACGCEAPADCDPGKACVKGLCAAAGCDANSPCNGGCCDAGACTLGNLVGKCGSDGKACTACGAGTPTCSDSICSAACVAGKPGDPGVCGMGFCCGKNDQCQALADGACGVPGALCADCSKSASGPKCTMAGACGCQAAMDCQKGQGCKAGACITGCDANAPCNSGCCSNGQCEAGNVAAACAVGGALCVSCAGNVKGAGCVIVNNLTVCGCASQADCPANLACDPAAKSCGTKCDLNNPCKGGCCQAGQCVKGNVQGACGENGGTCGNCAGNPLGTACALTAAGGHCGCSDGSQCPMGAPTCDATDKICKNACSANVKCPVGCCSNAAGGVCVNGTANDFCGLTGICTNCMGAAAGKACRANFLCGCDKAADCPTGWACDTALHACTTQCTVNQICNGGCCSNGTCQTGKDGALCGVTGNACLDCSQNKLGHGCAAGACGCTTAADCGPLQACDVAKKQCTSVCNVNQPCSGGCCQGGMCADGTANSACGGLGAACVVCKDGTPTCELNKCTAKCGDLGDGTCGNANCCSSGKCVTGTTKGACGFSDDCLDCTGSSAGLKCIQPKGGPYHCGCDVQTDCLKADAVQNLPGLTCDLTSKSCTTTCGMGGLTSCNGGCCSGAGGQCRGGGQDALCGVNGGFCNSCSAGCNPGPKCNGVTGACGCAQINDCFFAPKCLLNGAQREACSLPKGVCCIPSWFNGNDWDDNGKPSNCCTGMSVNGICTCVPTGQASAGDPARCCSQHDTAGMCSCLPNGAACLAESDANGECCSGLCLDTGTFNFKCVTAKVGQVCQGDSGCTLPLKCVNGKCG